MYVKTLTVSALNGYIKKIMDNDFILNNVSAKGEISNFKVHSSGHLYFSLKDEGGRINCVMFKQYTGTLTFLPEDGMKVILKGRVSVYQKDGSYQLYCEDIKPEGLGELYLAFQKLKDKLYNEGMFSEKNKKSIPLYAEKIGILTSPTGAAVKDIINVVKRRNKSIELIIYPALVQGINASKELIKGIEYFNSREDIDILIIARGGGSIEELWAFNDEELARSIYSCKIPVITGIGHETDFTIADYVSDRRAPTPSAAAEIAVWSLDELLEKTAVYKTKIFNNMDLIIKERYNKINVLLKTLQLNNPINYIVNQYNYIDNLRQKLDNNISSKLMVEKNRLGKLNVMLMAYNPLNVLSKGYAVIKTEDSRVVRDTATLKSLNKVRILLKDGETAVRLDFIEN